MRRPATMANELHRAWDGRELLRPLTMRVVRRAYAGTALGPLWLVARPLLAVGLLAFVFGGVLDVETAVPYPLFLVAGYATWELFAQTLVWTTRSVDLHRRLMRRIDLPGLLVVLSTTARAAIDVAILGAVLAVATIAYGLADDTAYVALGPRLLLVPAGLTLAFLLAFGIGLATAILNARWRDVRLGLRYPLAALLYLTPVLYPASLLPGVLGDHAAVNPLTGAVEAVRHGLFDTPAPSGSALAVSAGAAAVALLAGLAYFSGELRRRPLLASERDGGDDDGEA